MKDIFIIWITIQLMFIGFAMGQISNEIVSKTFDCNKTIITEKISPWKLAITPLIVFIPEPQMITDYCNNQKK